VRIVHFIPDWLIYFLLLAIIVGNVMSKAEKAGVSEPPPRLGPALPNAKPTDPTLIVEIDAPHSGIGTAFAVDNDGTWMTARHVVDSCSSVGLRLGGNKQVKMDVVKLSSDSDTALLMSRWKRVPLARDLASRRQIGERGFLIGFPQGRPGEVAGELIGRHRMLIRGRYRTAEPVLAWAEIGRSRGLNGSIGGLSGGPVFDKDGEVIGLVAAESSRRGRVYTVAPVSLANALPPLSSVPESDAPESDAMAIENYGRRADNYRRARRIAQVVCLVE